MKVTTASDVDVQLAPTIKPIMTINDLRNWASIVKDEANVSKIPLAKRSTIPATAMPVLLGFDMGEFQYDPWFTQWSQGGCGVGADGNRTAANVYNFSFWQYADISYYFGHNLLTIPPTVWTNAAHKNGVLSLGTLCLNFTENSPPRSPTTYFTEAEVANFLTTYPKDPYDGNLYLDEAVRILREIATYFGFDGYLVNFEDLLDPKKYSLDNIKNGTMQLLFKLKGYGCSSLWYDSPIGTTTDPNNPQGDANYLDSTQIQFYLQSNWFQSNYYWGPAYNGNNSWISPKLSWNTLKSISGDRSRVFSGIYLADGWSPPYKTDAFFAGMKLVQSEGDPPGFYTGLNLYYPDWVMYDLREHNTGKNTDKLPNRSNFHNNDQAFWAGTRDLENYPIKNKVNPIAADQCLRHYLYERTVITSAPFVTTFNDGEGDFYNIQGASISLDPWNNLSHQSILPSYRFIFDGGQGRKSNTTSIFHDDSTQVFVGGSSLRINLDQPQIKIYLYRTQIQLAATNRFSITFKIPDGVGLDLLPIVQLSDGSERTLPVTNHSPLPLNWLKADFDVPNDLVNKTMTGIGLYLNPNGGSLEYVHVGEVRFLDGKPKAPQPLIKFGADLLELDWTTTCNSSSHYRVYGTVSGRAYLIGVVHNSVYRVAYQESSGRTEASHIFNMSIKGFDGYIVQEVTAEGEYIAVT
jgi:endo-beta-N-acetylglucosaminidase D